MSDDTYGEQDDDSAVGSLTTGARSSPANAHRADVGASIPPTEHPVRCHWPPTVIVSDPRGRCGLRRQEMRATVRRVESRI